jgi:hypothetical protein
MKGGVVTWPVTNYGSDRTYVYGAGTSIFVSGDGGMYDCSVSCDPVLIRDMHICGHICLNQLLFRLQQTWYS